jgi:aldehyde:ferredoxin oxidoreductase
VSSFAYKPPYHIHNLPLFVSYATGINLDEDELWQIAARNRNLVRAINIRRGLRREEERPPEDHWRRRFPDYETRLLDEYYKFRGWNSEGIPTEDTLRKLSLEYVYEDLVRREILEQ